MGDRPTPLPWDWVGAPRAGGIRGAILAAGLLAFLGVGCGGSEAEEKGGPSLATPEGVAAQALVALGRGDLATLSDLMTPEGRERLSVDLRLFQQAIALQETDPDGLDLLFREHFGAEAQERRSALAKASMRDVLLTLLLLKPLPAQAPGEPRPAPGGVEVPYRDGQGVRRWMRLVNLGEGWRIQHLPL